MEIIFKLKNHILCLGIIFLGLNAASAQTPTFLPDDIFIGKQSLGFNVSGLTTSSGFGMNLNPSFYFRHQKSLWAIGPNIQSNRMRPTGLQGYFQHDIISNLNQFNIFLHFHIMYQHNATLGPISSDQYRNIYGYNLTFKHKALEEYIGLGFRKAMSERMSFDMCLGIGAYHVLNADERPNKVPFKSENDLSLMLKVGMTYDFKY
jgi:hypothetical protein